MLRAQGSREPEVATPGQGIQRMLSLMGHGRRMAEQRHAPPQQCFTYARVFQKAINSKLHHLDRTLPPQPNHREVKNRLPRSLKRISSLTWSKSLSLGLGVNPSRGSDAFAFPISNLTIDIRSYRQATSQGIFSLQDVSFYVQYDAYYWFGGRKLVSKDAKGILVALVTCSIQAQAQDVLPFSATLTAANEVPPNNDPTIAVGEFTLTGNSLSFRLGVPAWSCISAGAYIQEPATPGTNAPVIFDLGGSTFLGGNDFGSPPYYRFFSPFDEVFGAGPFTLTDSQTKQLRSGLWYANVTSYSLTNGQIRGQILLQPQATLSGLVVTSNSLQFTISQVKRSKLCRSGEC